MSEKVPGLILKLSPDEFEEKILGASRERIVLLEFWAERSCACSEVADTLERNAEEFEGRCVLARVDVEQWPEFAAKFCIQGIPTILVFYDCRLVGKFVGPHPDRQLRKLLDQYSAGDARPEWNSYQLSRDMESNHGMATLRTSTDFSAEPVPPWPHVTQSALQPGHVGKDSQSLNRSFGRSAMNHGGENFQQRWGDWYFEPDRLELVLDRAGCVEYVVDLEMCTSAARVLNQLVEIAGKPWIQAMDVHGLLNALDDLLRIQITLCPDDSESRLDKATLGELISRPAGTVARSRA